MSDTGAAPGTRDLQGKVVVVTGGGSGIGLAISVRLAADGAAVAVLDLNAASAEKAAAAITEGGGTAIGVEADVTDRAAVEAAVDHVAESLGAPTILVNNAGLEQFGPFLKIDPETWQRVHTVNLTGTYHCCQVVIPHMLGAGWGRIVNISSSSAQGGQPYMAAYVSSKAAVIGLTKSLALEFGPKGITVNTIPPASSTRPCCGPTRKKAVSADRSRSTRSAHRSVGSAVPRTSPQRRHSWSPTRPPM